MPFFKTVTPFTIRNRFLVFDFFKNSGPVFETKRIICSNNSISSNSSSKLFQMLMMKLVRSVLSFFDLMEYPITSSMSSSLITLILVTPISSNALVKRIVN